MTRLVLIAVIAVLTTRAAIAQAPPATADHPHPLAGAVIDASDGAHVPPAALAAALAAADFAALGEVHDNPHAHAVQAWLVGRVAPDALAFEMIQPGQEDALARLRAQGAERGLIAHALQWEARGWPDFAMYAPILEAAPDAPVTGGALAREDVMAAMTEGAATVGLRAIGRSAALYGLETPFAADVQADATAEQVAAHCDAIPEEVAATMVQAQRLRDAAFADAALRARALSGEGRVAMIMGNGHVRRDRGAPAALRTARPDLSVTAVAVVEVGESRDWRAYAGDPALYDFLWFVPPAEREDPCAAFRARMGEP